MATTAQLPTWTVFDCQVTQTFGLYSTKQEAGAVAKELGSCSFAYELNAQEAAGLLAAQD